MIIYADDRPHLVRLNEEIQAIGEMKLKEGVTKLKGEPVYLSEIEEMPSIRLLDSEEPNCGHFTLLLLGDRWYGNFEFRYNKGKAAELLRAADESLATASHGWSEGHRRAAIDNLFSAAELAAKAYVITTRVSGHTDLRSREGSLEIQSVRQTWKRRRRPPTGLQCALRSASAGSIHQRAARDCGPRDIEVATRHRGAASSREAARDVASCHMLQDWEFHGCYVLPNKPLRRTGARVARSGR